MDARADVEDRVLVRVLRLAPVRLLLLPAILYYLYLSGLLFRQTVAPTPLPSVVAVLAMIGTMFVVYASFVRVVERRPVDELAPGPMPRELGIGLVLGAGLYTACIGVLIALGHYRIDGLNSWTVLLPVLWFGLSSGAFEELLFRGVVQRVVEEVAGSWIALLVSSLVFGLVHLTNPQGTVTGALFISLEAGVLLGAAYLATGRLWLGMGFHAAWNYTQAAVFSGAGSGNEAPTGLVRPTISGPELLTGGAFGVEGSLVALVLCTTCGLVLLALAVRRGRMVPPPWRRGG